MGLFGRKKKKKSPKSYSDKHLNGTPQSIGQDSANEVFKVDYGEKYAMSGGETAGYFKPDATMAPAKNAVAASRLAETLGWGNLIPETKFATHDVTSQTGETSKGVKGAVSKAAKGEATRDVIFDTYVPGYTGKSNDYRKVRPDGNAYELSGFAMNDLDMTRSNTQQQLNQLQWFDVLIGNIDRHGSNILIDPETGNVTGIDNDLSFGDGLVMRDRKGNLRDDVIDGWDSKYLGLPSQLDEETAEKLLALSPEQIRKALNPKGAAKDEKLSDKALQEVYERLALIQAEVYRQKDAGTLIKTWDQSTYDDAINQQLGQDNFGKSIAKNYVQRHHLDMQKARDTADNDYWVKGDRANTAPGSVPTTAPWVSPTKPGAPTSRSFLGGARQAPPRPTTPAPTLDSTPPTPSSTPPNKPLPPLPVGATTGGDPRSRPLPTPPGTTPQLGRRPTPKVLQNSPFRGL